MTNSPSCKVTMESSSSTDKIYCHTAKRTLMHTEKKYGPSIHPYPDLLPVLI